MSVLPLEQRKYAADWFSPKVASWEKHVVPRIKNIVGATWLELGVYEGRSALWTLDHVLQGSGSKIYCLDPFDPAPWAPNVYFEAAFDFNVNGDERVIKIKGRSENVLPFLKDLRLNGAYIDGEHNEKAISYEATAIWDMLLPGGVLVFDDYGFDQVPEAKITIDKFLSRSEIQHEVLFMDFQAIILKTG